MQYTVLLYRNSSLIKVKYVEVNSYSLRYTLIKVKLVIVNIMQMTHNMTNLPYFWGYKSHFQLSFLAPFLAVRLYCDSDCSISCTR